MINIGILMTDRPSRYAEVIEKLIPELVVLKDAKQNILYHKETVWEHTMMCIDAASKVKNLSTNPLGFMLGSLLHDIGKPVATKKKTSVFEGKEYIVTTNPGHAVKGVPIAREICNRLRLSDELTEYVVNFVRWHDILFDINGNIGEAKAFAKIEQANSLNCLQDYILFNRKVDTIAKISGPKAEAIPIIRSWELIEASPLDERIKTECLKNK